MKPNIILFKLKQVQKPIWTAYMNANILWLDGTSVLKATHAISHKTAEVQGISWEFKY